MSSPFNDAGDGRVRLALGAGEREVLGTIPAILDSGGDAGGRLSYVAHPDDEGADERYQALVAGALDDLRAVDRPAFDRVLSGDPVEIADIESFMRVVGEARLVLANRIGITDDGWEQEADPTADPQVAVLSWLGYLQDAAVATLSAGL